MIETIESMTTDPTVIGSKEKCLLWDKTIPIKNKENRYEFGSRNMTKMLLFLKENKFTKEDYTLYKNLPNHREENETYDYYKIRRKFCSFLLKYKNAVKSFIFLNAIEDLKNKQIENGTTN